MQKQPLYLALFIALATDNYAQEPEPIQLDRPDQTECPFIVPAKYIQIENGFTYENTGRGATTLNYPSTLWKYGVNERFELRLITELTSVKANSITTSGLSPITVGFKAKLSEEKGIIPTMAFIGHITTSNVGSKALQTSYIAPSFRFTMQHALSKEVSLGYNLGAEYDGETAEPTYIYTLTTGISLTEKLGGYLEVYGFAPQNDYADHRFDCGFTYLLNNNLSVDLSGGVGLTDNAPRNYVAVGISYRFKACAK